MQGQEIPVVIDLVRVWGMPSPVPARPIVARVAGLLLAEGEWRSGHCNRGDELCREKSVL